MISLFTCVFLSSVSANTVFVEQYNSTFDYVGSTSVMYPMYYYLVDYNSDLGDHNLNFSFRTIYDYYIRLRNIGYYAMSIQGSNTSTITIKGRQDNQTEATLLFMPLSFSLDSLWSRPIELGDVLNYLTITLRSPLADNFQVYVDVGVANSNFDGYNLTDEFYQSIVWSGEQLFTSLTDYTYTIEGTINDAYWIVFKLSSEHDETVTNKQTQSLIEFKNFSCTFTHYEDKLDDVLIGMDGLNNTLNSGFSDINRGQLEIKDGLDDVNSSLGDLNNSILDTNDKLDNIEDILNTDKSDQINSGQFSVDLSYENFSNTMLEQSLNFSSQIFEFGTDVASKYSISLNFIRSFYTEYLDIFEVIQDILYVFVCIQICGMVLGACFVVSGKALAKYEPPVERKKIKGFGGD